jgi:hypothetical protein
LAWLLRGRHFSRKKVPLNIAGGVDFFAKAAFDRLEWWPLRPFEGPGGLMSTKGHA